ncbi:MAG: hypothetical protein H7343_06850 [Undibacterium sp.]|nr:hypothetical protein [Opitutaceae bacterium]
MRPLPLVLASTAFAALALSSLSAHNRHAPPTAAEVTWARATAKWDILRRDARAFLPPRPPAPAGVTDLEFSDFFGPIGDRGLELSAKLRALDGRPVRLVGFMVRQTLPTSGVLLLAPQPIQTDEIEYGACDDLPPQVVRVFVPLAPGTPVPLTPGPLLLAGRLELGQHSEPDGRNSFIRMHLDAPALTPLANQHPLVTTTLLPRKFPPSHEIK